MKSITLELLEAAEEVEAARQEEETYRWEHIGSWNNGKIPEDVRENWLDELNKISRKQIGARKRLCAAIARAREEIPK